MPLSPSEQAIQNCRNFFSTHFAAPSAPNQIADDVWHALESPIFKQSIFASNFLAIIDHSDMTYKYMSPTTKDFTGYSAEEFLEKGADFFMSLCEDVGTMLTIFEKIAAVVMSLPREERIHFHLCYDFRFTNKGGKKVSLYQQTIPLALNDQGYPYLMLCLVSDITEFKKDNSVNYRATLNLPGQPIKVLLSGCLGEATNLLTEREKEIVVQMAWMPMTLPTNYSLAKAPCAHIAKIC